MNVEELLSTIMDNPRGEGDDNEGTLVTEGQLNFVDLAGSEKISNHHTLLEEQLYFKREGEGNEESLSQAVKLMKDRIRESQSINKSLFFLT